MTSVNQNLHEESSNPQLIAGASVGLAVNVKQNWSAETFGGLVGKGGIGLPMPLSADLGAGLGVNIGFNGDEFMIGGGLGAGLKIGYLNTSIRESISLTDAEAKIVGKATDVWTESWIVSNRQYDAENDLWTGTVATRNTKGDLIDTGIKITSRNVSDDKGTNTPLGVWSSKSYQSASIEAEEED